MAELLSAVAFTGINVLEATMVRKDGSQRVAPDEQFPATMEVGYQIVESAAIYRLTISVDRPDLVTRVAIAAQYLCPDTSRFSDPEVARLFGEKVATPAIYPFARAKMWEITTDTGVPPVMLNLIDMTRFSNAIRNSSDG